MTNFKKTVMVALLAGMGFTGTSQASLIDRGGGLLYDTVLNVTWLQDANYAKTSGYSSSGVLSWDGANTWAANLVYHDSIRNVDYSDWRLTHNTPVNGTSFNYSVSFDGSTDNGYNITSPNSELAYMYYVNLGLTGLESTTGTRQTDFGIFGNGTFNGVNTISFGQNNVGLVTNLQAVGYWSVGEFAQNSTSAFLFLTGIGSQESASTAATGVYAWAVRSGDVAAVPVPGAVWLFGSGLIGLATFTRRKNKSANLIAA